MSIAKADVVSGVAVISDISTEYCIRAWREKTQDLATVTHAIYPSFSLVCSKFNSPSGSKVTATRGSMFLCDWVSITKVSSGPVTESLYQLTGPVSSRNVR